MSDTPITSITISPIEMDRMARQIVRSLRKGFVRMAIAILVVCGAVTLLANLLIQYEYPLDVVIEANGPWFAPGILVLISFLLSYIISSTALGDNPLPVASELHQGKTELTEATFAITLLAGLLLHGIALATLAWNLQVSSSPELAVNGFLLGLATLTCRWPRVGPIRKRIEKTLHQATLVRFPQFNRADWSQGYSSSERSGVNRSRLFVTYVLVALGGTFTWGIIADSLVFSGNSNYVLAIWLPGAMVCAGLCVLKIQQLRRFGNSRFEFVSAPELGGELRGSVKANQQLFAVEYSVTLECEEVWYSARKTGERSETSRTAVTLWSEQQSMRPDHNHNLPIHFRLPQPLTGKANGKIEWSLSIKSPDGILGYSDRFEIPGPMEKS